MSMLIEVRELRAEIERLRAALKPFAEAAQGDGACTPADWQRASAVYTNTAEQTEVDLGMDAQGKPHPF